VVGVNCFQATEPSPLTADADTAVHNVDPAHELAVIADPTQWRQPPAQAPAHVVCLHGIQSHGGWYEHSCGYLSKVGFSVCFLDRRGAGLNSEARGDAPGFRRLIDDLAEFIKIEKGRLPATCPLFLLAISWGGKLAMALERRHPGLVNGLALLCPGFYPKVRPALRQRLAIAAARLFSPRKLFPVPLDDPALFTANPRWQEFIQVDDLSLREATARLFVESVRLDAYIRWASLRIPVLLLLAENDRIIDNARTRRYIEKSDSLDKKIIEYTGAHHTLEFEPNPEMFLADLRSWLQNHLEKKK
jgi:alpha-beta hydrolase superfamily lysophospholipase